MSMSSRLPLLLISAALLQGCAEDRLYAISRATPNDAARARRIIREVAAEAGLPGETGEKYAHESVANYRTFNVSLQAKISGDHIDVWLSRTDWPPPLAFKKADRLLAPALSHAFGQRFGVSEPGIEQVVMF